MGFDIVDKGGQVAFGIQLLDHAPIFVVGVGDKGVIVGIRDGQQAVVGIIGVGGDLVQQVAEGD